MPITLDYPVGKDGLRRANPKQEAFHRSAERYRAFVGGVGSGKTLTGCIECIILCHLLPGNKILIGNNTYPQLRDSTQATFFDICPPELIENFNKQENVVTFKNTSKILFRSWDTDMKFRGLEIGGFLMDEASGAPEPVFKTLSNRLRGVHIPEDMYRGMVISNPNGKDWIYNTFFKEERPRYFGVVATTYENRDNLGEQYIQDLEEQDPEWRKRFLLGSFDTFSGQIFSEFREVGDDAHVIQPFDIPHHWYRFRGMDFGFSHPTAVLWAAEAPDGTLYFYNELYEEELSSYQLAEKVVAKSGKENYEYTIGDTSGASISQTDGESVYSQLQEYAGIIVQPAYKQDKLGRINRVKRMFHQGKIKIFNTCSNLIRELPTYQWEVSTRGQTIGQQRPLKINDHAIDAMLYLCGSRPDRMGLPEITPARQYTAEEKVSLALPSLELEMLKKQKKEQVYY